MISGNFEPMDEGFLKDFWHKQVQAGGPMQDWEEWACSVPRAHDVLIKRAQTESYDNLPVTYGALGGAIHLFSPEWFHLKIAVILWACSEFEYNHGRPLLTAIVVNQETMQPGKGFWSVSGIPPELRIEPNWSGNPTAPQAMEERRQVFWIAELRRIHDYWSPFA